MSPRGELRVGLEAREEHEVTTQDTAAALGSGSLPVLATPRLLAWCEAATCAALAPVLTEAETSVGTRVSLEHTAPTPVGGRVGVSAGVVHVDGRLVRFSVAVREAPAGRLLASGEVTRIVVDSARFLARVSPA